MWGKVLEARLVAPGHHAEEQWEMHLPITYAPLPRPHLMASWLSGPDMKGERSQGEERQGRAWTSPRKRLYNPPAPLFGAQEDQPLWSPHWVGPGCRPALEGHPPSLDSSLCSALSGTGPGHSTSPGLFLHVRGGELGPRSWHCSEFPCIWRRCPLAIAGQWDEAGASSRCFLARLAAHSGLEPGIGGGPLGQAASCCWPSSTWTR